MQISRGCDPEEELSRFAKEKIKEIGFGEIGGYIILPYDSAIDELRAKGYAEAGSKVLFHKWGSQHSFVPTDDLPKIYYRLTAKGRRMLLKIRKEEEDK